MAGGVDTGVSVSGTSSPCEERPDPCVFFDGNSEDTCSHPFDVDEPHQVLAYDLPAGDVVVLQQVSGANDGEHFEDVRVAGQLLMLDDNNNRILIPYKGRFRLRYVGTLGQATVVCEPSDCCFGPLFPQQTRVQTEQINDAFGVPIFLGVEG